MNREIIKACVLDYLTEVRNLKDTLEQIEEQVDRQTSRLTLLGVTYSDMPGSPGFKVDKIPEGVAELIELRERLDAAYYSFARDLERARAICRPVNFPAYLLWLHFGEGMTWWKVGKKVGYSTDHTQHLAAQGYEIIYQEMPERFRRLPQAY